MGFFFYRITSEIWVLAKYEWKSLFGVAISEAHGVLGFVHERVLRQGSVRGKEKID